jgi:pimeloyl-ACP methyl ester carboxylesterase
MILASHALSFFFLSAPYGIPAASGDSVACMRQLPIRANGRTETLLYCSNKSLDVADARVRRLIVVIHGTGRNAGDYLRYIQGAARAAGSTDALIVAPFFATNSDLSDTTESDTDTANILHWGSAEWKEGLESQTAGKVSSFAAVDELVKHVVDRTRFPSLERVIVTGHSAGGQFTERYAVGTRIDETMRNSGLTFRFIVANPSSYLYFTPERPVANATDRFTVPVSDCAEYDTYKYGIHGMPPYMRSTTANQMETAFKNKNVIYLLGSQDTDPEDTNIDDTCSAVLQGPSRMARGIAYYHYLGHIFGPSVYASQIEATVPGIAHDGDAMYNSAVARQYLFDSQPVGQEPTQPLPHSPVWVTTAEIGVIVTTLLVALLVLARCRVTRKTRGR